MTNTCTTPHCLLLSRRDAAAYLGISLRSIDYLVTQGQLRTRAIGRRRLVARAELDAYARSNHPMPIVPSTARLRRATTNHTPSIHDGSAKDGGSPDHA